MFRKREKYFKKWMLIFCMLLLAVIIFVGGFEAFIDTLVILIWMVLILGIGYYIQDYIVFKKTEYKIAYVFYRQIKERLFWAGYNVNKIFGDPDEFVKKLNHSLVQITKGWNTLTSIDIATAIIHCIVAEDDTEEFMLDVFLTIMEMLMRPKRYIVSTDNGILTIEGMREKMKEADIRKYISGMGALNFMLFLKVMYIDDLSLNNMYLWYIYEKSCV